MTRGGESGSVGMTKKGKKVARSIDKRERAAEGVGPYGRDDKRGSNGEGKNLHKKGEPPKQLP